MPIEGKKLYLGNEPITLIQNNGFVEIDPQFVTSIIPPPYYTDLVRWFEADTGNNTSSTWEDLSGNQNGTVGTDVSFVSATPSYYDFTGTATDEDNVVDASPNPVTGTQNHTVVVWFNASAVEDGVLSYLGTRPASFEKIVMRITNTGTIRVEFEGAGTTTNLAYETGSWYQAAYVFDGTTIGDVQVYLNGLTESSTGATTLNLGSTYAWSGAQNGFHPYSGNVGTWLIYDRALSASEIAEIFNHYGPTYGYEDSDAQAFLTETGITDPIITAAITNLVLDLKSAGIWSKIDALYPFVGGTASTHKYNLKDPRDLDAAFRITFNETGNITHDSDGVQFENQLGWANTHLNSNTDLNGGSGQDSNHMFCSFFNCIAQGGLDIGTSSATASWHLNSRNATDVFNTRNMSGTLNSDSGITDTTGVWGMSRTSSTAYTKYKDKTSYAKTVSTTTPPNLEVYFGGQNNQGSIGNRTSRGWNLLSMGGGLTTAEWEDFVDINTTFQNSLSR